MNFVAKIEKLGMESREVSRLSFFVSFCGGGVWERVVCDLLYSIFIVCL